MMEPELKMKPIFYDVPDNINMELTELCMWCRESLYHDVCRQSYIPICDGAPVDLEHDVFDMPKILGMFDTIAYRSAIDSYILDFATLSELKSMSRGFVYELIDVYLVYDVILRRVNERSPVVADADLKSVKYWFLYDMMCILSNPLDIADRSISKYLVMYRAMYAYSKAFPNADVADYLVLFNTIHDLYANYVDIHCPRIKEYKDACRYLQCLIWDAEQYQCKSDEFRQIYCDAKLTWYSPLLLPTDDNGYPSPWQPWG